MRKSLPGRVSAATLRSYTDAARRHLIPAVGASRLDRLTVADCDRLWTAKLEGGFAPDTVRVHRATLRRALGAAEREGLLLRNVAALSSPVRLSRPEGRSLTLDQARALLERVAADRLAAAYLIAIIYGPRRGELLGLAWEDYDTTAGVLHLRRNLRRAPLTSATDPAAARLVLADLKTARSRRTMPVTEPIAAALATHRRQQQAEREVAGEL